LRRWQPEVASQELVQSERVAVVNAERQVFGVTHAEVGAYLLGMWGVPTAIVEAVAWHHSPTPSACPGNRFSLVTAIHAAEAILGAGEGGGPDLDYLARIGLADQFSEWVGLAGQRSAAEGVS
jgi:HD-like signal output (HDOD) protein